MCCDDLNDRSGLPPQVVRELTEYRRLLRHSTTWGEENFDLVRLLRHMRFVTFGDLFAEAKRRILVRVPTARPADVESNLWSEDFDDIFRTCIGDRLPPGLVHVYLSRDGIICKQATLPLLLPHSSGMITVLLDSALDHTVAIGAGASTLTLAPNGAKLVDYEIDSVDPSLSLRVDDGSIVRQVVAATVARGTLHLRSSRPCRWSVVDSEGGAWFAEGALRKWDFHGRPFFHGNDLLLDVPSGAVTITASHGLEFEPTQVEIEVGPDKVKSVKLEPERRFDPRSSGWFGADLHVHMNYAGDHVCEPRQAAMMQLGEGLDLMNLVTANSSTSRLFDLAALESWTGDNLYWSSDGVIARMGVEYRNDLLGHVHTLGVTDVPKLFHSGHRGSDREEDWPPNSVACMELPRLAPSSGTAIR